MAKPCVYTYKGKSYSELEFKQLVFDGEFNDDLPEDILVGMGVEKKEVKKTGGKKLSPALQKLKDKKDATKIRQEPKNNQQQYQGTDKQQQGKQADRADKKENDTEGETGASSGNISEQSREEKIAQLEAEKQQKINEVTKPDVDFDMGISNVDLANTTAQNRHDLLDIKARLQSLNQIIKCLWV